MTTVLEQPSPQEAAALEAALAETEPGRGEALRKLAAGSPLYLEAWARLGEQAYVSGDEVAAYAFFRTGYHRGLDRLRAAGWRGSGSVPFSEPGNRGFLLCLKGLMRAAAAIGEGVEARRCREFLLELDPDDPFGIAEIRPADLGRRLADEA